MMKITIAAVGKLKEKYLQSAALEYEKRISRYAALNIEEIPAAKLPEDPTPQEIESALLKEGEKIKRVCEKGRVIALCIEGEQTSSEGFADIINEAKNEGVPLTFVIGGSHGLHKSVSGASYKKISFSKMTFPHRLFRVMLLEQIYRAFKITEGGRYHK